MLLIGVGFATQRRKQIAEGLPKRLDLFGTGEPRPMLLDTAAGGDRDRADRFPFWRQEDELRAPIGWVGSPLDVAGALELRDGLGRRLLAHMRQSGELADVNALGRHKWEDIGVRGADIVKTRGPQRVIDFPREVLVNQTEQQNERRARR